MCNLCYKNVKIKMESHQYLPAAFYFDIVN